ncbi:F0F1 ATP synthase subunit B [Rubrivirga sp. IMCC43871]|uniref:F0F1 ATP synthase subunit B n=1 Tax=Rubrivirga sp. IMCC43871 TaxID=3391575 RepID=UPI00398FE5BA
MVAFVLAADLLTPNAGLAIWMLIAFLIVLFVLSKFAFPAMLDGLKEREKTIEDSLAQAERANAEAKALLAQNDEARRDSERQAQTILREAKEQADSQRAADVDKTKAEIARLQESARADIEREKLQALAELRREVATLAVAGAEKILSEKIDGPEQSRLVDRFIADLPQN